MAKFNAKKISIPTIAGALVGGAGGGAIVGFIPIDNTYVKAGILAAGGAALSAFVGGDLVKGVGSGMIGLAGAQIAAELLGSDISSTKGVGSSPWQAGVNAVGILPSQRTIGTLGNSSEWIRQRTAARSSNPAPRVNNVN